MHTVNFTDGGDFPVAIYYMDSHAFMYDDIPDTDVPDIDVVDVRAKIIVDNFYPGTLDEMRHNAKQKYLDYLDDNGLTLQQKGIEEIY